LDFDYTVTRRAGSEGGRGEGEKREMGRMGGGRKGRWKETMKQ